jgi:hypothetical protein
MTSNTALLIIFSSQGTFKVGDSPITW